MVHELNTLHNMHVLSAIKGLVDQADAQKKVRDKYLSVRFSDVEVLRDILVQASNSEHEVTEHALSAIKGLVEQADAQKKAGDEHLSVSFIDVEMLRGILVQ